MTTEKELRQAIKLINSYGDLLSKEPKECASCNKLCPTTQRDEKILESKKIKFMCKKCRSKFQKIRRKNMLSIKTPGYLTHADLDFKGNNPHKNTMDILDSIKNANSDETEIVIVFLQGYHKAIKIDDIKKIIVPIDGYFKVELIKSVAPKLGLATGIMVHPFSLKKL